MNRKPIFDAVRRLLGRSFASAEVDELDAAIDAAVAEPAAAPVRRSINREGLAIVKESEGLALKAYTCPAGILTIGYGSTGNHVKPGMVITEAQAEELLRSDLRRFEDWVAAHCKPATDNQFSALVSLAFNIGEGALKDSTLRRKHLEGDYAGAADQFARWNKGGGKVLPGLVKRRSREAALYRKATA